MTKVLLLLSFLMFSFPAFAQVRDSVYFMMDDGEMSPEEMALEAEYVHGQCEANHLQKVYYDCACVAGAFLQRRESLGPMYPQQKILFELFRDPSINCSNSAAIAGKIYGDCQRYAPALQTQMDDHVPYCECVANRTASAFARAPRLNVKHVGQLHTEAMAYCESPPPDMTSP